MTEQASEPQPDGPVRAADSGFDDDYTRTASDRPSSASAWRAALGTWWGKLLAILGVLGLVNGAIGFGKTLSDWIAEPPSRDAQTIDRLLPRDRTPAPGVASGVLGFGDANGGRTPIPYAGEWTSAPASPTFNSFVDLESAPFGDERKFVGVKPIRGTRYARSPKYSRLLELPPGRNLFAVVYVDNNAANVENCAAPRGPRVAFNTRIRVAIWRGGDGKRHVLRAWISANNAFPAWVTDAALVTTREPASLELVPSRSSVFRDEPKSASTSVTRAVFREGGMPIGTDGQLGSCFINRLWVQLVFRQQPNV